MNISIFGMGYVGAVSAACLARDGHRVTGVDPNPVKLDLINRGKSPIIEAGVDALLAEAVRQERLRATDSAAEAIAETSISLVCVGTPSNGNGSLDLRYVGNACEAIGRALRDKQEFHTVVLRSTMLPGSMRDVVVPTLEEFSGKRAGVDFGVCNNPEFLREGTAVKDYDHPPKIVVGETDAHAGDQLVALYQHIEAPLVRTDIETAEMVKYVDNVWHALKVGFANEIGNLCKSLNLDGHRVMDIFCKDTKLNLSPYYLKPGFAFGGSCLPKDVRALTYKGKQQDLELPILNAILPSNRRQVERAVEMVTAAGSRRIGVLGMSFKAGTDDLRESPMVSLIETLIGKGFDVRIYDRYVQLARLTGANRDYILNHIPHISGLLVDDVDAVVDHADVLVIGNNDDTFGAVAGKLNGRHTVIDLARVDGFDCSGGRYDGICW